MEFKDEKNQERKHAVCNFTIMETIVLLVASLILLTLLVLFISRINKKKATRLAVSSKDQNASISGQNFVAELKELGYFKYTAPENLGTLKKEIETVFDQHKVLATAYVMIAPFQPFCYRLYSCDGETLFELGGIEGSLKDIKPTFDKLNIPLHWREDHFSDDASEHSIIINDKKYFAFKGDPNDPEAWGIATSNFVEIINDQLTIHDSDERVYPILCNNDGQIIFLTDMQYQFISLYLDKTERPMDIGLWWQTFG